MLFSPGVIYRVGVVTNREKKYMASTHNSDPYSAFECQFTCNANDHCTAYFVWYGELLFFLLVSSG